MKHFLHHLLFPRESNNYRPKVLHFEVLFLIVAFLMSAFISLAGIERQYPAVLGDSTSISVQDLLTSTNLKRQANGLAPLKLNSQLNLAAQQKAKHMFAQNYWAHVAPDGTTPWVFIKDSGYEYLYAGENLARGFNTGSEVVDAWMNSPSHKENMLSPNYTDIGFAVLPGSLTGNDTVLVVQMFGSPYAPKEEPEQVVAIPNGLAPSRESADNLPTPIVSPQISITAFPTSIPLPIQTVADSEEPAITQVASVQTQPLVDAGTLKRNMSFVFLVFFIAILVLDMIIVKRKSIARDFSHNLDHILFLLFILLAGIIIGKGAIL